MDLEKMQKVNEILQLCFEISRFEQRQKEKTGDKPTIFAWFSGHSASFEIRVYEKGWYADKKNNIKPDKQMYLYLDEPLKNVEKSLDNCIQYLNKLKERKNNEYLQQAI